MERMRWLQEERDVDRLFQADFAILYKHSATCGVCRAALREVETFLGQHPDADVYAVDVLGQRDLSQRIAARTGIKHESPQIIIFQGGSVLWSDSHYGITAEVLAKQFKSGRR